METRILNLYAIKGGMDNHYDRESGEFVPVTVLDILPNDYLYHSDDGRDVVTTVHSRNIPKNVRGILSKFSEVRDRKVASLRDHYVGKGIDRLGILHDLKIDSVTVQSVAKSKGFQGCMRRWGFKGLGQSHGVHTAHRSRGGIAAKGSQVWKGTRMPGRMGGKSVTVENLRIVAIDLPRIVVKGSVPGSRNRIVKLYLRVHE